MPTLVFLLDVDNTLIDNDNVKKDFDAHLQVELGPTLTERFWDLYERIRKEEEVVNIPRSLKELREQTSFEEMDEQTFVHVLSIFENYPFFQALYPHTLETLAHLRTLGITAIVSDGDPLFQPEKIFHSNLADAVEGRVLIYIHKQQHLDEILSLYRADHYVMIDDKPDILHDSKQILGSRLTTVFVLQGKYAAGEKPSNFAPDITVQHIGDLRTYSTEQFLGKQR